MSDLYCDRLVHHAGPFSARAIFGNDSKIIRPLVEFKSATEIWPDQVISLRVRLLKGKKHFIRTGSKFEPLEKGQGSTVIRNEGHQSFELFLSCLDIIYDTI